jgi:phosphoribosylglycinamide formyltransferase 1
MRKRIAVFASGFGSNLQALIDFSAKNDLVGDISLVFSNNAEAKALERAAKHGINSFHLDPADYANREEFEREILKVLEKERIDIIVLAGYMFLLTDLIISKYRNRILNIHPAILPSFKGAHGIKDAYDYGVKVSGVTVHFADAELDHGPIIMQEPVYIDQGETVEKFEEKIHIVEHKIYPLAVQLLCQGRLRINGRKVEIL